MKRIGVFVCHCGINIAGTVDVKKIAEEIGKCPGVVYSADSQYMCSEPGQELMRDAIKKENLEGVVVAACSPNLHEVTFRRNAKSAGLNPYLCEIANIREQCSWIHSDREKATFKALEIVKSLVEKVKFSEALFPIEVPITKKALVIGGGIAGIQAALDIANTGYETILVEKEPSIGGHMAQLSETFPTLDCSQCILTPRMVEVGQHPKIKLLTYSEVEEIAGCVGNFKAKIRRKASFVDWQKCTGCGVCIEKCPVKVPSEFDRGIGLRKVIHIPFPQAVPNKPVIDKKNCLYFIKGKCKVCERFCSVEALDFGQKDSFIEEEAGAIVVATGYELYPREKVGEYGYGKYKDVIDSLIFERLLSASGPTKGEIRRPSDGKVPKQMVFIQCVGSRDEEKALPYCSKICCMYTAKHAMLYKHRVPEGQAYIFYIDIRAGGKGYEEFVQKGIEEGTLYLRGKVSKLFREDEKIIIWGVDTLTGRKIEIAADMVVLATGIVPGSTTEELAKRLKVISDSNGFLSEAHPKLRPVETLTSGIFLAGCAQSPKDIPESVAQAGGAASKVLSLLSGEKLIQEPTVAYVNEDLCSGCGMCVSVCKYKAIELITQVEKGKASKSVKVTDALCEGCGSCVAACPSGAMEQKGFTTKQLSSMIEVLI
ncbi:MAG: 4Fe-4S binding protein [bacterium]